MIVDIYNAADHKKFTDISVGQSFRSVNHPNNVYIKIDTALSYNAINLLSGREAKFEDEDLVFDIARHKIVPRSQGV